MKEEHRCKGNSRFRVVDKKITSCFDSIYSNMTGEYLTTYEYLSRNLVWNFLMDSIMYSNSSLACRMVVRKWKVPGAGRTRCPVPRRYMMTSGEAGTPSRQEMYSAICCRTSFSPDTGEYEPTDCFLMNTFVKREM